MRLARDVYVSHNSCTVFQRRSPFSETLAQYHSQPWNKKSNKDRLVFSYDMKKRVSPDTLSLKVLITDLILSICVEQLALSLSSSSTEIPLVFFLPLIS
ncbi:unnamed protein product [Caenorhabditis nigoni]